MKLNQKLFRSRAGRTVFVTFIVCSFLPIIIQSFLTEHWIERQLVESAEQRLSNAARASQMALIESMQNAQHSLELLVDDISVSGQLPQSLIGHAHSHFSGVALSKAHADGFNLVGNFENIPSLNANQQGVVDSGELQLFSSIDLQGDVQLYLARLLDKENSQSPLVIALLRAEAFATMTLADAEILITNSTGHLLFSNLRDKSKNSALSTLLQKEDHGGSLRWMLNGHSYRASCKTIFMQPQFHTNWKVLYGQEESSILAPVAKFKLLFRSILAITFLTVLFFSTRQIGRFLQPLQALQAGTKRFASFDFSQPVEVNTQDEFQELAGAFNGMGKRLKRYMSIERELHAVGMALAGENDSERVMEIVLDSSQVLLDSDSARLFLVDADGALRLERIHLGRLGMGDEVIHCRKSSLESMRLSPPSSLAALTAESNETLRCDDWKKLDRTSLEQELEIEETFSLPLAAAMAISLRDQEGDLIGILQVGRLRQREERLRFNEEDQRLFEAIAAQASMAFAKNQLITSFRNMMMSMTEVFAMAVDAKSPYTGAHCRRVPELTMMLAESASKSSLGSLDNYCPSEEELFELKVAAQLHDCGKVVTPTHIMDKRTKLETIIDRIELINLRFEIIQRDRQISSMQHQAATSVSAQDKARSQQDYRLAQQTLLKDRAFLNQCNIGSERMPGEDIERVRDISRSYNYHSLDGAQKPLLSNEETTNLSIPFGTLNLDERKIINDHIVHTIEMLSSLSYPKGMERIPLLAGAHHERMDGKGYPNGLTRDQIPVGGRIMGIADVFEALTDNARPYKSGKSLQEALEILGKMVVRGHLDEELFQVFMDDRVYLAFAEANMSTDKIWPLDLSRIKGWSFTKNSEGEDDSGARKCA